MSQHYNRIFIKTYNELITFENIYNAWENFKIGKTNRKDVNDFALHLTDNLLDLYYSIRDKKYQHSEYYKFEIIEVKKRVIHKASVRDRIVHRLIYDTLYNYFDDKFIFDSYSCRKNKGTHKALERYEYFFGKVSENYTKQSWVLKFDIKKCFENVNQEILLSILEKHIKDKNILNLCKIIIHSFSIENRVGLPLGNLTSQLFINIYLHELDFYIKQVLNVKYYIRYADDCIIMTQSKIELEKLKLKVDNFIKENLKLLIHKVEIKTAYSGVDFLGFIHFKKHRILRKSTKKKILRKISDKNKASYLGLLKWGNCYKVENKIYAILNKYVKTKTNKTNTMEKF